MKSFPIQIEPVTTRERNEIVDLTDRIAKLVRARSVQDGMVILFSPHTTAGVTINENYDPDVKSDLLQKLSAIVPQRESFYQHDEGNSDSHLKTALIGNSATILIENGRLVLGQWQEVYFCEFDGPRERKIFAKIVDLSANAVE